MFLWLERQRKFVIIEPEMVTEETEEKGVVSEGRKKWQKKRHLTSFIELSFDSLKHKILSSLGNGM